MPSKGCASHWEMLRTEHTPQSQQMRGRAQGTNLPKEGLSSAWDAKESAVLGLTGLPRGLPLAGFWVSGGVLGRQRPSLRSAASVC